MGRTPVRSKQGRAERRKNPRSESRTDSKKAVRNETKTEFKNSVAQAGAEACASCSKDLAKGERALFVEEEIGRIFCSEECITHYFAPEIERLEKEFFRRLSPNDLTGEERESLAHLRWITLQEPDEVWREKTLNGDHRYTLISEFQPDNRKIWSICICLFLRGEPSFLYLAFVTRNSAMANAYRRGERIPWESVSTKKASKGGKKRQAVEETDEPPRTAAQGQGGGELIYENPEHAGQASEQEEAAAEAAEASSDRLADRWTEDETFMVQSNQARRNDDIPTEDFNLYQGCLEGTLQEPDEIWTLKGPGENAPSVYHFIRKYQDNEDGTEFWYLIIARETPGADGSIAEEDDDQEIEILDAFPTRDPDMVDRYRRGTSESGQELPSVTRVVH